MQIKTLPDVFGQLSEQKGIIFVNKENEFEFLPYYKLKDKALKMLAALQEKGLKKGEKLIFQLEDNCNFLITFWACILGGIIPVPLTGASNERYRLKLLKIWTKLESAYLICDKQNIIKDLNIDIQEKFPEYQLLENFISARTFSFDELSESCQNGLIESLEPHDIAFVQFSSGSTGDPKGVVLSHENLITNINAIITGSCSETGDSSLCWMPLTHDMGLVGFHLSPIVCGANQYLMTPSLFIKKPLYWLQLAHHFKITTLCSPNFGFKYFLKFYKQDVDYNWDLSNLRLFFNGAEPISADLVHEFLDKLSVYQLKRTVMFPVYGMAEASLAVTFPDPNEEMITVSIDSTSLNYNSQIRIIKSNDKDAVTFVDLGKPVQDCEVRIVDATGNELPELRLGHIQIRGKNVTRGYYQEKEVNKSLISQEGWLSTGDMGFFNQSRLIVTGRFKDVIFVMGQNFYSHDIEQTLVNAIGIEFEDTVACGLKNTKDQKDDIIIFIKSRKKNEDFVDTVIEIKSLFILKMGLEVKSVIPVLNIPKTTSGKKQRFQLLEDYKSGVYQEIESFLKASIRDKTNHQLSKLTKNEVEEQLLNLLKKVIGVDSIGINDNLADYGLTSNMIIKIITCLDQLYPGKINQTDFFSNQTLSQIARLIINRSVFILRPTLLPEDFFANTCFTSDKGLIFCQLDMVHLSGLAQLSLQTGLEQYFLTSSFFAYVLSCMSRSEVILNLETQEGDFLHIQFNYSQSLNDYIDRIKWILNNPEQQIRFVMIENDSLKFGCKDHSVHIVIYQLKKGRNAPDQSELFDFVLGLAEDTNSVFYELKYRNNRLNSEKIKKLMLGFQNSLDHFFEKI